MHTVSPPPTVFNFAQHLLEFALTDVIGKTSRPEAVLAQDWAIHRPVHRGIQGSGLGCHQPLAQRRLGLAAGWGRLRPGYRPRRPGATPRWQRRRTARSSGRRRGRAFLDFLMHYIPEPETPSSLIA